MAALREKLAMEPKKQMERAFREGLPDRALLQELFEIRMVHYYAMSLILKLD